MKSSVNFFYNKTIPKFAAGIGQCCSNETLNVIRCIFTTVDEDSLVFSGQFSVKFAFNQDFDDFPDFTLLANNGILLIECVNDGTIHVIQLFIENKYLKRGGGKILEALKIHELIKNVFQLRNGKRGVSFDAFFEMLIVYGYGKELG